MGDEEAFLAALAERPGDDLTRLVFADWLDERGDGRAAYLRLVVEVAERIKTNRPHRRLATRVRPLAEGVELSWREVAGKRFSLRLDSCKPARRVVTIIATRGVTGVGLAEAISIVDRAPIIVLEQLLLEDADRLRRDLESGHREGQVRQTPRQKCCSVSIVNCVR